MDFDGQKEEKRGGICWVAVTYERTSWFAAMGRAHVEPVFPTGTTGQSSEVSECGVEQNGAGCCWQGPAGGCCDENELSKPANQQYPQIREKEQMKNGMARWPGETSGYRFPSTPVNFEATMLTIPYHNNFFHEKGSKCRGTNNNKFMD